jgi:hypothetical protein
MGLFVVSLREHIIRDYLVEAETLQDAESLVMEGEFIEVKDEKMLDCFITNSEEI